MQSPKAGGLPGTSLQALHNSARLREENGRLAMAECLDEILAESMVVLAHQSVPFQGVLVSKALCT